MASGLLNSARQVGGSLGLAMLVTVAARVTGDGHRPADLAAGYSAAFWVCAALLVVAACAALLLLPKTSARGAGAAAAAAAAKTAPETAADVAPDAVPVAGPENSQKNFQEPVDPDRARSTQG